MDPKLQQAIEEYAAADRAVALQMHRDKQSSPEEQAWFRSLSPVEQSAACKSLRAYRVELREERRRAARNVYSLNPSWLEYRTIV